MRVADEVFERMVALRRDLHAHPELSWKETRTAGVIADELRRLGLEPRTGVAGTGLYADIPGAASRAVALRGDMDALPITEQTGLGFASTRPGVMHACGHDGHVSMVLGAAAELVGRELPAPVRLLFQPAEEVGRGAEKMVEAGVLEGVGAVFGGHLDRHFQTGQVVVQEGAVNASTDRFVIVISGEGGHGARPHLCVDAVVVGSALVQAIQTIVSRTVDPARPCVVSVGRFDAPGAHNVIAGLATLEGTIRALDPQTRALAKSRLAQLVDGIAATYGARVELRLEDGTPPVINEAEGVALARAAALRVVGEGGIARLETANMGGEDFSYFLRQRPGCYLRFGAQKAGCEAWPAHSSRFDFDEGALAVGAAVLRELALEAGRWLQEGD